MTPERRRQIDELVQSAQVLTSAQRETLLAAVDPDLRREVEALLAQKHPANSRTPVALDSRLGPYKIEASIGKGGMGEVFRAVDTRLDRKVAIKIATHQFDGRFEREARAISALNHPHICTLYDVGPNFLVMELLEGETLAARLKRGKLPIEDTLRYGSQIADALAEAHAKGITHRDLKPGNIMISKSRVKVLDFGLAKLRTEPGETLTAPNVVMGTPAYMAPEQFRGMEADARTDIYALGLVLHEMATGQRWRPDQPQSLSALPSQFAQLLDRCLAPDPDNRWQSVRDLKAVIDLLAIPPPKVNAPKSTRRRWLIPGLGALALVAALVTAFWLRRPPKEKPFKFSMLPPDGTSFLSVSRGGAPALSPDGLRIAFVAEGSTGRLLWVRSLDGLSTRSLAGTEGATGIFWSPDGQWIAFFSQGNLKKVALEGGAVQFVASGTPSASLSGSWNSEDKILFYPNDIQGGNVLKLVNAAGGQPLQATSRNNDLLDENHYFPSFLPDGQHYLLEVRGGPELDYSLWLGVLGSNNRRLLLKGASNAHYVPPRSGAPGYLLFARNGSLLAQPFDADRGALFDTAAVTVAENVAVTAAGSLADFTVSPAGILAYRTAERAAHEMVWYDRTGREAGTIGDHSGNPRSNIRISPDGKSVAFTRPVADSQQVWVHDLVHGVSSCLTLNGGRSPVWSPDGSQIAFVRDDTIYRMPVTGGAEAVVWRDPRLITVNDWSGDGKFLLFTKSDEKGVRQTLLLPDPLVADSKKQPVHLADGIHSQFAPATGPARWVCTDYRGQVTIHGMPGEVSGPWQVSTDGGIGTRFRRDGLEMYFTSGQSFMAMDIDPGSPFRHGAPHVLFPLPRAIQAGQGQYAQGYDVTADGSKFLATFPAPETPAATITVIKNWQAALRK